MITDREIDDIARAMTGGEPSGALRARVMQQLEPRVARPARAGTFATAAKVVGGACAVAAGVIILNRQPTAAMPQSNTSTGSSRSPARSPPTGGEVRHATSARPRII